MVICENAEKCQLPFNCPHKRAHVFVKDCEKVCYGAGGSKGSTCIPVEEATRRKEMGILAEDTPKEVVKTELEEATALIDILEAKIMEQGQEIEGLKERNTALIIEKSNIETIFMKYQLENPPF